MGDRDGPDGIETYDAPGNQLLVYVRSAAESRLFW